MLRSNNRPAGLVILFFFTSLTKTADLVGYKGLPVRVVLLNVQSCGPDDQGRQLQVEHPAQRVYSVRLSHLSQNPHL